MDFRTFLVGLCYFLAAVLVLVGLRRMSARRTARGGIAWAGWGMVVATLVTFFRPGMAATNLALVGAAMATGGALALLWARKAAATSLPGMIALHGGLGAGAAGAIGAARLLAGGEPGLGPTFLAALGGLVGSVACAGSLVAFARMNGWIKGPLRFKARNQAGAAVLLLAVIVGLMLPGDYPGHTAMVVVFFVLALAGGAVFTAPVSGSSMPVVIAFYSVLTGGAVAVQGFVLGNDAMVIAGTVAAAGAALLTSRIAEPLGRSVASAVFGTHDDSTAGEDRAATR